jgi:hypothetical protein
LSSSALRRGYDMDDKNWGGGPEVLFEETDNGTFNWGRPRSVREQTEDAARGTYRSHTLLHLITDEKPNAPWRRGSGPGTPAASGVSRARVYELVRASWRK